MNEFDKIINLLSNKLEQPKQILLDTFTKQMHYNLIVSVIIIIICTILIIVSILALIKTYKSCKSETWAFDDYYEMLSVIGFIVVASGCLVLFLSTLFIIDNLITITKIIINPNMYMLEMIKNIL